MIACWRSSPHRLSIRSYPTRFRRIIIISPHRSSAIITLVIFNILSSKTFIFFYFIKFSLVSKDVWSMPVIINYSCKLSCKCYSSDWYGGLAQSCAIFQITPSLLMWFNTRNDLIARSIFRATSGAINLQNFTYASVNVICWSNLCRFAFLYHSADLLDFPPVVCNGWAFRRNKPCFWLTFTYSDL